MADLITNNLEESFRAIQDGRDPSSAAYMQEPPAASYLDMQNYASPTLASTGSGLVKTAGSGIIYTQPTFFSPIHTPINWQIPSKRKEIYQWCRFYYENEPKVATAVEFYSRFPINGYEHECQNRYVKRFYDRLKERLKLERWLRIISHEVHLLGDCFPFAEIACSHCNGTGAVNGQPCEHDGGDFKRLVILNPEYTEVYSDPMSPEQIIAYIPSEELRNLILKKGPGYDKFSKEIRNMIAAGAPIPLDNRNVDHIKYMDNGYNRYGIGMIRRLFPILAYKTKLMTAQWIVAERLILPIKIAKVGSDERPASAHDLAQVQAQLAQTANDPNLTLVTHHAFELDWFGAAGKVLQLSNEFDLINDEVLDGLGINKALLNGEGPTYSNAAIGVEVMIDKLDTWRKELAEWIENKIYLPVARMKGFVEKNEWGEMEYVYPKIKWNIMHLRDQQQYRQFILQLHEKGLISSQRVLETFDIDYDEEVELLRYERAQGADGGAPGAAGGLGGGFGDAGGGLGGGGDDLGGLDLGGLGGGDDMGMGGAQDTGAMGGMGAGGVEASSSIANIKEFGGKVLGKKTREKIKRQKESLYKKNPSGSPAQDESSGVLRDQKGRIMLTSQERKLLKELAEGVRKGEIRHNVTPQFPVQFGQSEFSLDFAMPDIKIAIEVDGELFHSTEDQKREDNERDMKLKQLGWTVLRFKDKEVETQERQVMETIIRQVISKENYLQGRDQAK
jgi:very-short-patch-repair endonuclease